MDTTILPAVSMSVEGAIYETALSLEGEEREDFLDRVFYKDPPGRRRIDRLLERSGKSSAFFLDVSEHGSVLAEEILGGEPAKVRVAEDGEQRNAEPGAKIGPYEVIARIGEGGCGVVYEAEQREPVHRRVALKIIRLGMDTENVIARFAAERQALALMDHPNIAHVYDAGATDTGRPYFVMERVSGERITTVCDRQRLNIFARIHLFIQVCHAIQHAHQKGVIHRDIKPSNILVTVQDGVLTPKVIDFGIAKATVKEGGASRAHRTMLDQIVGTPAYMSPEQVDMSGIDVDTRSDIYSLGALFHELLVGRPPFDETMLTEAGISEMRRTLMEVEPPLPSRMLAGLSPEKLEATAAARSEQPARLIGRIRGDLDGIVAKALAKNRDLRYQTVNALTTDLRRFLANEPVTARRPSRVYLLQKFFRRNRVACVSGAVVMISLVACLGAATAMYLSERKALAEQARLREEAEVARSREERLREQAQARANVSQAAVLLSEGKMEEADALLRQIPLESIEPSREAAGVYRALGNWNAIHKRWDQAVRCYVLLDQANRLDDPVTIVEETDLLMIGPAVLMGAGEEAYEKFRQETLARHLPAQNSLQAEHLLKVCLLTPASPEMMARLKNVAEVCLTGVPGHFPQWEAFSMTLYYHRLGDVEKTLEWADKCLSYHDPIQKRAAAALALRAMAKFRTGDEKGARKDLVKGLIMLRGWKKTSLKQNPGQVADWFSWLIAGFLLEEAQMEIEGLVAQEPVSGHH